MNAQYSSVVERLRSAGVPVYEIGEAGKAAITLAAGRVVAMAFSPQETNLFWSNPVLDESRPKDVVESLAGGGMGGDRLWFAPELAYHWDGVPDWRTMSNYKPPTETDPGEYAVVDHNSTSVTLRGCADLLTYGSAQRVAFQVERTVRITEPPLSKDDEAMRGVACVGIETSHVLRFDESVRTGVVDLWHLLQVPVGAVLVVPTRRLVDGDVAEPLSYALPGGWMQKPDHVVWRFGGVARAKFGLPATAVTGRAAVVRQLHEGRWCMLVREFPCAADARYCDHPYAVPRTDQVLQAWDGDGFGELEYHSPALDAHLGPRQLAQTDRLWAFGGSSALIARLAHRLLGVDVGYLLG